MKINDLIYKVIGFDKLPQDYNKQLVNAGFIKEEPDDELEGFLQRSYLDEYLAIMFHDEAYIKDLEIEINILGIDKTVIINEAHISCFPGIKKEAGISIYSLDYIINTEDLILDTVSDITNRLNKFNTRITYKNKEYSLSEFVDNLIKPWPSHPNSDVNQYNGSRWKEYHIYNFSEQVQPNYNNLLFELGTGNKIGTINNNDINSPSEEYLQKTIANKLSCFKNYEGLALYDSFTIIGNNNYSRDSLHSHSSWNSIYFKIFLYCHFMKCKLQLMSNTFSSSINKDAKKAMEEFEEFYNRYYLKKIAFNFLPNEIYMSLFKSLELEEDFQFLKSRNNTIALSINEKHQRQQEFLLLIISVMALLETPTHLESIRTIIGIEFITVYNLTIYGVILSLVSILMYMKFVRNK